MSTLAFLKKRIPYDDVRQEVEASITKVADEINPYAIYLFGSLARDEFTDQSDIDLLIITHSVDDIRAARKAVAKIRPFSRFPVDVVWMSRDDFVKRANIGGIAQIVKEEGRLMFGETP